MSAPAVPGTGPDVGSVSGDVLGGVLGGVLGASSKSASDQISDPPGRLHLTPSFYCVYLLQSIPRPQLFYVGSTPDPVRRLRQHNGILKSGGAYRTKRTGARPWRIVALVHGFASNVAALQFEHALQHPHSTRHIAPNRRVTTAKASGRSIHHKFANIRLLVNLDLFCRMGLQVLIFDGAVYTQVWVKNTHNIDEPVDANVKDFSHFFATKNQVSATQENFISEGQGQGQPCPQTYNQPPAAQTVHTKSAEIPESQSDLAPTDPRSFLHQIQLQNARLDNAKRLILASCPHCDVCSASIDYLPDVPNIDTADHLERYLEYSMPLLAICYHDECGNITHLSCLANQDTSNQIIPVQVRCQKCTKLLFWPSLVKTSTKLRHYALRDCLTHYKISDVV